MTWLLTSTGRQHYLTGPAAQHPDNLPSPREVAHSLAHINRFTGHASRAYSVAEHSLLVMAIAKSMFHADAGGMLAALWHDAHESIVGDVTSPAKIALGSTWTRFEAIHENHLRFHYGTYALYEKHHAMVKACDLIALATERRDLLPFDSNEHDPWMVIDHPGRRSRPLETVNLNCWYLRLRARFPALWARDFRRISNALLMATTELRFAD